MTSAEVTRSFVRPGQSLGLLPGALLGRSALSGCQRGLWAHGRWQVWQFPSGKKQLEGARCDFTSVTFNTRSIRVAVPAIPESP